MNKSLFMGPAHGTYLNQHKMVRTSFSAEKRRTVLIFIAFLWQFEC